MKKTKMYEAYKLVMRYIDYLGIKFSDVVAKSLPDYCEDERLQDMTQLNSYFWRTVEFQGANVKKLMELQDYLEKYGITFDTSGGTRRMWNIDWSFKVDQEKFNLIQLDFDLVVRLFLDVNYKNKSKGDNNELDKRC